MMIGAMISGNGLDVNCFLQSHFNPVVHSKCVRSLSNALTGVLKQQSLILSRIGEGLAEAKGLLPKHAKKQVDRLLSNDAIDVNYFQSRLARLLISQRRRIYVAMDWTVFAKDKQMTLTLRLITTHGRATPLLWQTVSTEGLKGTKNDYVHQLFARLRTMVPQHTQEIVLADSEFGTLNNMTLLKKTFNFDYILRIKRNFTVTDKQKRVKKLAHEWLNKKVLTCVDDGFITVQEYPVKKVVICQGLI